MAQDPAESIDYECELVIIIGKPGRDIPESKALDYVFGYSVGNDISHREWQINKGGGQWYGPRHRNLDSGTDCSSGVWVRVLMDGHHLALQLSRQRWGLITPFYLTGADDGCLSSFRTRIT